MEHGVIYSSRKCLNYGLPGHPERPERVEKTLDYLLLKKRNIQEPSSARKEDLLNVYSKESVESVKNGNFSDPDTPFFPNIHEIALLSAGSALDSYRSALSGIPAFSLMRPPGHHSGLLNVVSGFCYFNNIAIAVTESLKKFDRVAILDVDVHHGNGTQDIFLRNEKVLFCSLHQVPLYPGTGSASQKNCFNFSVRPGSGEKEYLEILDRAIEEILKFNPKIIAVSAGFDTYKDDPLANLNLEIETYGKIGAKISSLKLPRFAVLEGGYSMDLPYCIESFLSGFFLQENV